MSTLLTAVLAASFAGSGHCAGMCGPLAALAFRETPGVKSSMLGLQAGYQGGRLASYALLGAAVGALGGALDLGGSLVGLQQVAMFVSGALLIGLGAQRLAARLGWLRPRGSGPGRGSQLYLALNRRLQRLPAGRRALGLGMLSALLPCGWLYAFAAVAAGTGGAVGGALVMLAFWLGGLPVMLALGAGLRRFFVPLERRLPLLGGFALMVAGLLVLRQRGTLAQLDVRAAAERGAPAAELHTAATETPACCEVDD